MRTEVCLAAHPTMFVCCCFSGKYEISPLPGAWQTVVGLGPHTLDFPPFPLLLPPLSLPTRTPLLIPYLCSGSAVKPLNKIAPRPPPFRPPGTTLPLLVDGPAPRWLDTVPMGHIAAFYLHRPFFSNRESHTYTRTQKRLLRGKMWYGNMDKTYNRSFLCVRRSNALHCSCCCICAMKATARQIQCHVFTPPCGATQPKLVSAQRWGLGALHNKYSFQSSPLVLNCKEKKCTLCVITILYYTSYPVASVNKHPCIGYMWPYFLSSLLRFHG
jgi:hypothetical protein